MNIEREKKNMFGKGNFSGQFRRLPTVSIGGASKSESKDELIRRAQQERRQREVNIALTWSWSDSNLVVVSGGQK